MSEDAQTKGVELFRAIALGGHGDRRRVITDVIIPFHRGFAEAVNASQMLQTKIIVVSETAVNAKMVLGNHYHINGRHELFVVRGESAEEIFLFCYISANSTEVEKVFMRNGDACYVPPGITHAFVPLADDAVLFCWSNLPFSDADDVKHEII